jgi:hypothetical protein
LADALVEVQQVRVDDQNTAHPMPIQRVGFPARTNGADSPTIQLVNAHADDRRSPATPA